MPARCASIRLSGTSSVLSAVAPASTAKANRVRSMPSASAHQPVRLQLAQRVRREAPAGLAGHPGRQLFHSFLEAHARLVAQPLPDARDVGVAGADVALA